MMIRKTILLAILACVGLSAQARERLCFDKGWRFILADTAAMATPEYHDASWRQLDVPHDWAIEGDFFVGNPSGAGGGALPGGIGWYRKTFELGREEVKSEKFFLEFDGVYMNSTVYVNGQKVEYDITPYIHVGTNLVAVRVDNSDQPNSRWYSGCGIYRHVWLTKTHPIHVKHWGVFVNNGKVEVDYENPTNQKVTVKNIWLDANGKPANIKKPRKWSCEDPYVYTSVISSLMPRRASGSMARTSRSMVSASITTSVVWELHSARMPSTASSPN